MCASHPVLQGVGRAWSLPCYITEKQACEKETCDQDRDIAEEEEIRERRNNRSRGRYPRRTVEWGRAGGGGELGAEDQSRGGSGLLYRSGALYREG